MKLHDVLLKKAAENKLAHFYILEGADLLEFTHNFIREYYQKIEKHKQSLAALMDHPDVYVLGNTVQNEDSETKAFTVEEAEALSRFFDFRPVQAKRKFAVITEAHRMNATVANKWLKLLEEPVGETTIMLLNPTGMKLLDTIHSRAIHLKLPRPRPTDEVSEWKSLLQDAGSMSLAKFIETYSRGATELTSWVSEVISWEALQEEDFEAKEALKTWLKQLQEMEVFHQPTATKWTLFYYYLQEWVLPRFKSE